MSIDERARYQLFQKLEGRLGPDEASTLMELLPPVGWADVATKRDVDALAAATKRDVDSLKHDLAGLAETVRLEHALLRAEARAAGEELRVAWKDDLIAYGRHQTTTMVLMNSGVSLVIAGIALGAARFL